MPKETMTGRERWLAVLNREKPDRTPMDIWATGEAIEKLCKRLNCDYDEMIKRLHIDRPFIVWGDYIGPEAKPGEDIYGLKYRNVDYGTGEYVECCYSPLAQYESVEEIEANYTWPDIDCWDYSRVPEMLKGKEDRIIQGGGSEPFLQYKNLRGEEQAFMDLILNPEMVHYILGKLFDWCYENTRRLFEAVPGKINLTYIAEDVGGQETLMYSPNQIRTFLHPQMKRMIELTKQNGSFVFHHTDGAVRDILPDLIGIGIDILNPIQWRCPGMEREDLKKDFGEKLIFHGGVDNQYTIPFGTVEEVRQEVIDNLRILGEGGGYVLAPCHNIQAVGPAENMVALFETGYEYGWSA
ncbi:MAG: uroporphyrinogen-III decarboxylase-like protein [Armatimonadetes bacterium]|nr:uroporphyrinogen-III decarboxylase-like protein [Armatimonadota bacterium]